jgi:hypothetical protein
MANYWKFLTFKMGLQYYFNVVWLRISRVSRKSKLVEVRQ